MSIGQPTEGMVCPYLSSPISPLAQGGFAWWDGAGDDLKPGYLGTLLPTLLQGWQPSAKWQSHETLCSVSRVPRYMPNSLLL